MGGVVYIVPPKGGRNIQHPHHSRGPHCCMLLYFHYNTISPRRSALWYMLLHFHLSGIQHITAPVTVLHDATRHGPASDRHCNMRCCIVLYFRVVSMQHPDALSCITSVITSAITSALWRTICIRVRACAHAYGKKKLTSVGNKPLDSDLTPML